MPKLADYLAIQIMRSADGGQAEFRAEIDRDIPLEVRDGAASNSRKGQVRLLAYRARCYFDTVLRFPFTRLKEAILWAVILVVVVALAVLLLAFFGYFVSELFVIDQQGNVAVERVVRLVGLQLLIMLIPAVVLCGAWISVVGRLFARRNRDRPPAPTFIGLVLRLFTRLMVFGYALVRWASRKGINRVSRQSHDENARHKPAPEVDIDEFVAVHERPVALLTATVTHAIWLAVMTGVLAAAYSQIEFHRFGFSYPSNRTAEQQLARVEFWGRPAAVFTALPDEQAVIYAREGETGLFEDLDTWKRERADLFKELSPDEINSLWEQECQRRDSIVQQHRATWSDFMWYFTAVYAWFPRVALLLVTLLTTWLFFRDLRPDVHDSYFQATIKNVLEPPVSIAPDTVKPDDKREPEEPPNGKAIPPTYSDAIPQPQAKSDPSPGATADTATQPDELWVLSYEVTPPDGGWSDALPRHTLDFIDLGELNGLPQRESFLQRLDQHATHIRLVLIWGSLTATPDRAFEMFLRNVSRRLPSPERIVVLLTDGESLRKRFRGDSKKTDQRVNVWSNKCKQAGLSESQIWQYDHESITAASRDDFERKLTALLGSNRHQDSAAGPTLVGRFPEAFALIRRKIRDIDNDPAKLRDLNDQLQREIHELYRAEATSFFDNLTSQIPGAERVQEVIRQAAAGVDLSAAQQTGVGSLIAMQKKIASFSEQLRPRWAIAGGILGTTLAVGGIAASCVFASPALPAVLATALPNVLLSGVTGLIGGGLASVIWRKCGWSVGAAGQPSAEKLDDIEPDFVLDDLVRTATLWVLVLELQGWAEAEIAAKLNELTTGLAEEPLHSFEQAEAMLTQLEDRLCETSSRISRKG